MLTFRIDESTEQRLSGYMAGKIEALEGLITEKLNILNAELQRRIVSNMQGPILNQVTGKAVRSVEMIPAQKNGYLIEASVQAGGGVAYYLKFQEEGTDGPYEIAPKNGKALSFLMFGKLAFFKRVQHPGLSAKRPIGATFDAMREEILSGLESITDGGMVQ